MLQKVVVIMKKTKVTAKDVAKRAGVSPGRTVFLLRLAGVAPGDLVSIYLGAAAECSAPKSKKGGLQNRSDGCYNTGIAARRLGECVSFQTEKSPQSTIKQSIGRSGKSVRRLAGVLTAMENQGSSSLLFGI